MYTICSLAMDTDTSIHTYLIYVYRLHIRRITKFIRIEKYPILCICIICIFVYVTRKRGETLSENI